MSSAKRLQLTTAQQHSVAHAARVSLATLRRWLHGLDGHASADAAIVAQIEAQGLSVVRPVLVSVAVEPAKLRAVVVE